MALQGVTADTAKVQHPVVYYIAKPRSQNEAFLALGTFHTLPLSCLPEEINELIKAQSHLWIEIGPEEDKELCVTCDDSLKGWFNLLNTEIKNQIIWIGFNTKELTRISYLTDHLDNYPPLLALGEFYSALWNNIKSDGCMDIELSKEYQRENKPVNYMETEYDRKNQHLESGEYYFAFCKRLLGNKLPFNTIAELNNARDWSRFLEIALEASVVAQIKEEITQRDKEIKQEYLQAKLEQVDLNEASSCDERTATWFGRGSSQFYGSTVASGWCHVLEGKNGILKRHQEAGFITYELPIKNDGEYTPQKMQILHKATQHDHLLVVQYILEKCLNEPEYKSVLSIAIENQSFCVLRYLVKILKLQEDLTCTSLMQKANFMLLMDAMKSLNVKNDQHHLQRKPNELYFKYQDSEKKLQNPAKQKPQQYSRQNFAYQDRPANRRN
ncbi:MAG: hypothetical protein JSS07_09345 [Proteobacteria bacterium]|nr:hypothetical protein [Pseudomonadota bacterium]